MLNWGLWFIHVFISTLFISGFLTLYGRYWNYIFRGELSKQDQLLHRGLLAFLPVGLAILLACAAYVDPINSAMYMNLTLFVVTYPILDDRVNLIEYLVRCAVLWGYWLHFHQYSTGIIIFSVVLLTIIFVVNRIWHERVHYLWWADGLLAMVISGGFWLTQVEQPIAIAWSGFFTFMLMNAFAFMYWSNLHALAVEREQLEDKANYDALTNVKSYALFRNDSAELFANARQHNEPLTLVMLDIDHFKAINDRYGHMAGNEVLSGVARLLDQVLYERSGLRRQIYRTGGEEFNIAFPKQTPGEVRSEVETCWQAVRSANFSYEGKQMHVTISMGMTEIRDSDVDFDALYSRVDDNLYQSKRSGRDTITIDGHTLRTNDRRVSMLAYTFFTQPIINDTNVKVVRNELLVRTYDPDVEEWVVPSIFNLTATAQIAMMQRALAELAVGDISWKLSEAQFVDPEVATELTQFARTSTDLEQLTIELVSLPAPAVMHQMATLYHEAGINIVLDDVGTANTYASASMIDIDEIKFSLTAMRATALSAAVWPLVAHWLNLAQKGHKVFTLEGVENEDDVRRAKALGITRLQGYYYGRPTMPEIN
jgi:diguanylate cyclase (GGDEF)-like protein